MTRRQLLSVLAAGFVGGGLMMSGVASGPSGQAMADTIVGSGDIRAMVASTLCAATDCPPCVVMIKADLPNGQSVRGTGVLLANGNVLTARHVVTDDWNGYGKNIHVIFGGRNGHPRVDLLANSSWNILRTDKDADLAIISGCQAPEWAKGVVVSGAPINAGDMLVSVGLEHAASIRLHAATVDHLDDRRPYALMKVQSQHGNSGGPVFNKSGELVGIVSALTSSVKVKTETEDVGNLHITKWSTRQIEATSVIDLPRIAGANAQLARALGR